MPTARDVTGLGDLGSPQRALAYALQALARARRIGYQLLERDALDVLEPLQAGHRTR